MSEATTTYPTSHNTRKHEKRAPLGAFFVSGTTPTSHNTKHTKNTPVWACFLCLGLPPPTPPPKSCRTHRRRLYGHVLCVRLLFSPKTRETRPGGCVSRSWHPLPSLDHQQHAISACCWWSTPSLPHPPPTTPENERDGSFSGG